MAIWLFYNFLIAGFVLLFDGVVQLCVRKKTGPWKEGGASLLAGAIIVGVPLFVALTGILLDVFSSCLLIAGLVLALNGVVQLCVKKKTGPWKEGGASLLAGAIIAGVSLFGAVLAVVSWTPPGLGLMSIGSNIAGLVLALNGVVQLCVRKKTGPWKEGGASLLAGGIIAVVHLVPFACSL
jgi:predicted phage tail protein